MEWAVLILGGMCLGLLYQNYRDTWQIHTLQKQLIRSCRAWDQQTRRDDAMIDCLCEIADHAGESDGSESGPERDYDAGVLRGWSMAGDKAAKCLRQLGEKEDGE